MVDYEIDDEGKYNHRLFEFWLEEVNGIACVARMNGECDDELRTRRNDIKDRVGFRLCLLCNT